MRKVFVSKKLNLELETGRLAGQADGSVWLKQGGTVVLATVVASPMGEFPGFFPLTIDYREQMAAAGKIPGGYFKREGRPTDKEVLTGRLIDRAIRPLFPANYFNQVQIIITVYSVDKQHQPHTLALIAASAALTFSKIPFLGPVGITEVARIDGKWTLNPKYSEMLEADAKVMVAGTHEGINMVEGCTNEISEKDLIDILFMAHDNVKDQVEWQLEIQKEVGIAKAPIESLIDWDTWSKKAEDFLDEKRVLSTFIQDKVERNKLLDTLKEEFKYLHEKQIEDEEAPVKLVEFIYDQILKDKISDQILARGARIDGRGFEEVRAISTEVGLLPFTHGSALFTRGRTQALVTLTLGGGQDEQKIEDLMGNTLETAFMLHYNFLPFSVGETRPMRGPGRREVGHGYLAKSALHWMLPSKEKFPYTIRLVADILESNGSTSMAAVCGSTMALMNGGVPIKKMVSGIAMGLLGSKGNFKALTDITGIEDAFGLMDFKVAGTETGITAIQMDIKYKGGLPREVFEKALDQAKRGRLHILHEMQKVMSEPNPELSELVPQIISFKVPSAKIGAIIGSGGKTIREIIDNTDTMIDIEDDGLVKIYGHPGPKTDLAVNWVKTLSGLIEPGSEYHGKVKRIAEFGLFVEIVPGLDGLVHVSTIPRDKQSTMDKDFQPNQPVLVEVISYDDSTGRIRLKLKNEQK